MAKQKMRVIQLGLPESLDDSLNALVKLSGTSKRSLVRDALVAYLGPRGVLSPVDTEPVPPSPTRGTIRTK